MKSILALFTLLFLSLQASALVDYSDDSDFEPQNSGASSVKRPTKKSVSSVRPARSRGRTNGKKYMMVGTRYESVEVKVNEQSGKVHLLGLDTHFQTPYNFFLDASYWQASSSSRTLSPDSSDSQKGNPKLTLGFNWLEFGGQADRANIDLEVGMIFSQSNSAFAQSRTDRFVGLSTAKRFHEFALGLGYHLYLTGTPGNEDELDVGSIRQLSASLGWMVSRDIRFLLEASHFTVGASKSVDRVNRLENDMTFSSLAPKLHLTMSRYILLELGARIRNKRLRQGDMTRAKLWNLSGPYGNSMFVGLVANI
jgi:hypothetical protein